MEPFHGVKGAEPLGAEPLGAEPLGGAPCPFFNLSPLRKRMSLGFAQVRPNPSGDACFSTVDPRYAATGSPARMEDGRIMTDYRPRCFQYPVAAAQAFGDNEYRNRMIHGANELMEAARQVNNRKVTATTCVDTMVPELYKRVCTWKGCKVVPGNFMGIGTGRIYVPLAESMAANPQRLAETTPSLPGTFARNPPSTASQCAIGDSETEYRVKGDVARFGGSAKSHPYSAPRA